MNKLWMLFLLAFACVPGCGQDPVFRPPSDYVRSFISSDSIEFQSISHRSFRIYFREDSYTASHLTAIRRELDLAWDRLFAVFDIADYPWGIYLIALDSKEDMETLMGYRIKGGAAVGHDLVFFVFNEEIRPQFKHEIFHLLAYEIWGPTPHRLLDEGGATYADHFCFYDNPMYTINAWYASQNELLPFKSLVNNFDEEARIDDVKAYIQSAGIFKYLYENYGVARIKRLWMEGFEAFESIYGFTLEQLEVDWILTIRSIPLLEDFDIERIKDGCG